MSQILFSVDDTPEALPFPVLAQTLASLNVPFNRKGEDIALKDPRRVLTSELMSALRENKGKLLTLADLRAGFSLLSERMIMLRCQEAPKGTRVQALTWLFQQIEKLAAQSVSIGGSEDGWPDPFDVFAANDQIAALRHDLVELETKPYPVPLPEGCRLIPTANFDPFEHGRYYSGALMHQNSEEKIDGLTV